MNGSTGQGNQTGVVVAAELLVNVLVPCTAVVVVIGGLWITLRLVMLVFRT